MPSAGVNLQWFLLNGTWTVPTTLTFVGCVLGLSLVGARHLSDWYWSEFTMVPVERHMECAYYFDFCRLCPRPFPGRCQALIRLVPTSDIGCLATVSGSRRYGEASEGVAFASTFFYWGNFRNRLIIWPGWFDTRTSGKGFPLR